VLFFIVVARDFEAKTRETQHVFCTLCNPAGLPGKTYEKQKNKNTEEVFTRLFSNGVVIVLRASCVKTTANERSGDATFFVSANTENELLR